MQRTVSLQTVGCRLNQYETERMAAQLYPFGFRRVRQHEPADLYIINTCTVTHRADADCRRLIHRATRQNPSGRVVVVGCYVEREAETIAGMEGVDVVITNRQKEQITRILPSRLPELFDRQPDASCATSLAEFHEHNRAWIKISDGCNQRCSYCIVTVVRGNLVNRPGQEIIDEVRRLVAGGYKEVVLTGVSIGYYKDETLSPPVKSLAALCRAILEQTDLYRLRLSSVEPQAVSDALLSIMTQFKGRFCRHFHLPLQSGSTRLLRLMHRPYTPDAYLRKAQSIKEEEPDTTIGTDVMVGFPGETDSDFEQTRQLCRSGFIDYLHVFSYSHRPGTAAAEVPGKVNQRVIKDRSRALTQISDSLRYASHRRQVGKTLEFIAEHGPDSEGNYGGRSDNYLRAKLSQSNGGKEIIRLRITGAGEEFVTGEVIQP
ncbi:MAG TPA: tRNA (N(6)-L-threonylcarbamoyladenosine(37)-C(2))-methylthiotransferase MtaB [Candidatus Deferrimicrobium sp.]|nr:tRNA (N(6)-L-threonylcarbamoyladenosine(37)-C(2))-methylthiotransferase MtaB [Candidatus Deferrimicrobium sp.]